MGEKLILFSQTNWKEGSIIGQRIKPLNPEEWFQMLGNAEGDVVKRHCSQLKQLPQKCLFPYFDPASVTRYVVQQIKTPCPSIL